MTFGDAFSPRFRRFATKPVARLGLTASIAIALTACQGDGKREPLNWMEVPSDPQVYAYVLNQCLTATRGPASTEYNDWDEAIVECTRAASSASSYCPTGAKCLPNVSVSLADVRRILPSDSDTRPKDGDVKQAPLASSAAIAQRRSND